MKSLLLLCLLALAAIAADVPTTLEWDAVVEPDISHYVLKVGTAPGVYTRTYVVPAGTRTTIQLPEGVIHYAAVVAVNTSSVEGTLSDELAFQTGVGKPPGKPGKPRKVVQVFTIGGATVTVTVTEP